MTYSTIVSTDELASLLGGPTVLDRPAVAVVDCRFTLDDPDWGTLEYEASHIPGAVYAHLDHDLSGTKTGRNGRHPLPDPTMLAQTLSRLGIGVHTQVVAYDQDAGAYASRLWWLLRWLGHDGVAVLDGGFSRWTREARPTRAGIESRTPTSFAGTPNRERIAVAAEIVRAAGSGRSVPHERSGRSQPSEPSGQAERSEPSGPPATPATPATTRLPALIDARAPERYRGEVEPIDRVGGHIPGASNYHYLWNVDAAGRFRPPEWIRARVERELGTIDANETVCYCGSGVTACHLVLALELAGFPGARLYAGSWSEWSNDPTRPVERGTGGEDGEQGPLPPPENERPA